MSRSAITLYRITSSELPTVSVGKLIADRGRTSPRTWTLYDTRTGDFRPGFTGVAVARICPECFAVGHAGTLDHPGDHGPTAPIVQPSDGESPREG